MSVIFCVGDIVRIGVMGAIDSELATVSRVDDEFNVVEVVDHIHGTILESGFSVYNLVQSKNSHLVDPFGLPEDGQES